MYTCTFMYIYMCVTVLLVGRSRDRIPVASVTGIFLVDNDRTTCPGVNSASKKWVPGIHLGVKAAGVWGWRPTTLAERQEIRGLNLPGPPWAISTACCGRDLYLLPLNLKGGEVSVSQSSSRVKILRLQFFMHFLFYSICATCPTHLVLLHIIRPNRIVAVLSKFTSTACIIINVLHSNLLTIFSWYNKGKQPGIQ